jgi:hypothetical protein
MLETSLALLALSCIAAGAATLWAYRSFRRHQANLIVSEELARIIASTHDTIDKTKKTIAKSREAKHGLLDESLLVGADGDPDIMSNPDLMATLITVLIHKYGDVRLGMKDFMIPDSDYVSVYVDTGTQEIILSLNKDLSPEAEFINFTNPDDSTYH